ncbi:transcriptional coactivator p15/PC4 family protein [Desulfofundulus thermocisternus]|uniref:transcriptional coactivator p15/PC4 family protein n=1 Tax=Desulfofundulus thermocisternus TaxID=42471 RepID=UPI00217CC705|nr:transcriptional coactivator p15/PC4 family protein [Desulfofundulus thermocisternus]MCS5696946.1 transcriptional coactivator p15/PC4 family protein [Desulfofundulus thermocisternus]
MPTLAELAEKNKKPRKNDWAVIKELGAFAKTANSAIAVRKISKEEEIFYDLRVFFLDSNGNYQPTKKGIMIPTDEMVKVIQLIQEDIKQTER